MTAQQTETKSTTEDEINSKTTEPVVEDPTGHEEPEDYALRLKLGLRAVAYRDAQSKGSHPDQRPCPSWCWVGQHPEYDHEIEYDRPMIARHDYEPRMPVVASLYSGMKTQDTIQAATIEFDLSSKGAGAPTIGVYLRSSKYVQGKGWHHDFVEKLRLTITDAQEVATVLSELVRIADQG